MKGFKKINKFLYAKNLFKRLAFIDLEGLNEFTDSFYLSLDKELVAYDSYVKKSIDQMPKELHEEFLERMSDDYWKYAEGFPHITGYLLLVRYYSLLEHMLRSVAQNVQNDVPTKIAPFIKNLDCSLSEKYLKYLKNAAGFNIDMSNASWAYIHDVINPIRNCVTHDDGYIESSKKCAQIKKFISDNPKLISLTSYNKIEIKKDFIYKFREVIASFFEHVFQVWGIWAEEKDKENKTKIV